MIKVEVTKNLVGLEDLLVGVGTVTQTRGNVPVTITKINAQNFPFNETNTLAQQVEFINTQYEYFVANRPLMLAAVEVKALMDALSVHIDDLALWLVNGDNHLSAFKPFAKQVIQDEVLADGVNYAMLEDTVIAEDVTITLGVDTKVYVIKGEEFTP